jgi:hypothetical protein
MDGLIRFLPRVRVVGLLLYLVVIPGCFDRGEFVRVAQERDALRVERDRLQRELEGRNARIAALDEQMKNLIRLGSERRIGLFAPIKIEILPRSQGADYDEVPGDDGVTVYLRPVDADGHAVKVPGEIRVQLLDNTNLATPRKIGDCVFNDPQELRRMWYGRFGTDHYTIKCRFFPGVKPPNRVLTTVEFLDYLTGKPLTVTKELPVVPGT